MLNHAGLGCGTMAEHLPTMSKALSSIPTFIKPIIRCGELGVVVQTCNPSTQGNADWGLEAG